MSSISDFPFLEKIVSNVLKDQHFDTNNSIIKIKDGTNKGEGFMGEIYFVSLKDKNKELEVIVKSAPKNKVVREKLKTKEVYMNEVYFYRTVIRAFNEFNKKDEFKSVAKYYGSVVNDNEGQMLCLENLKAKGFQVFEKKLMFDKEHIELVFENYARFHAMSFAFKDQKPKEYTKIAQETMNLFNIIDTEDVLLKPLNTCFHNIYEIFKTSHDLKLLEKLKKYTLDSSKIFNDCVSIFDPEYSAVLHGDCWTNNMMFKYEKMGNKIVPVDMRLLDFQLVMCGSPANDLSYTFYSSASTSEYCNLEKYLKLYHDTLSKHIRKLGSNPEKVYPYSRLMADWKMYGKFGFMMGLLVHKIKLTENDKIKDFTDLTEEGKNHNIFDGNHDKDEYEKRVKQLVLHLHEFDAL